MTNGAKGLKDARHRQADLDYALREPRASKAKYLLTALIIAAFQNRCLHDHNFVTALMGAINNTGGKDWRWVKNASSIHYR